MGASVAEHKNVGEATYEAVSEMIREGKKPAEAFAEYGNQTGKSPATVATAYYRIARKTEDAPTTTRPRKNRANPLKTGKIRRNAKEPLTHTERLAMAERLLTQAMFILQEMRPAVQDADLFAQIKQYIPKR